MPDHWSLVHELFLQVPHVFPLFSIRSCLYYVDLMVGKCGNYDCCLLLFTSVLQFSQHGPGELHNESFLPVLHIHIYSGSKYVHSNTAVILDYFKRLK